MSFIKKAVKKVFKVVKKIVKSKWFKIAVMAALTVFTMGVGTIGFSAFATQGFFSAIGTTMTAGWASIGAGLGLSSTGMFSGATASTNAFIAGQAAANAAAAATTVGAVDVAGGAISVAAPEAAAVGAATGSSILSPAAQASWTAAQAGATGGMTAANFAGHAALVAGPAGATPGAGGWLPGLMKTLGKNTVATSGMWTGIMGGVNAYMNAEANKEARELFNNERVMGVPRYGPVDGTSPFFPTFGERKNSAMASTVKAQQSRAAENEARRKAQWQGGTNLANAQLPNPHVQQANQAAGATQQSAAGVPSGPTVAAQPSYATQYEEALLGGQTPPASQPAPTGSQPSGRFRPEQQGVA